MAFNTLVGFSMKINHFRKLNPIEERSRIETLDKSWFYPDIELKRQEITLSYAEHQVPTQMLTMPQAKHDRVLLYLHGGAFMFRLPNAHASMIAKWGKAWQTTAYMPWYRLAPENPYPAGIDDCFYAWRSLLIQGISPTNIVIGGDSAGGNLTLSLLHRIKAAGDPMPACAFMLSPVVDMTMSSESLIRNESLDPIFDVHTMLAFRQGYVREAKDYCNHDLSPVFADMHGYPPLLFQCSSTEMLCDESVRAAERAHAHGVDVQLQIWEKMPHVFQAITKFPQAQEAMTDIISFVSTRMGWKSALS